MMLWIETGLLVLALILAVVCPALGASWFEKLEIGINWLARRRRLAIIVVGLATLTLRAALLPVLPIPEPIVHDEFGYLLAADTFAHGRLTNPTHPMWTHFETFSIIQKPTYQCFAQPAQGITLALGQVVFGHPFWGVWLSAGLMCAALCWMLQAWMPARWALIGSILAILRYSTTTYWANSYWGGAMGAIGGALLLGALPRIKRMQRVRDAVIMGVGLAILANSRPFEGFAMSLPVAASLFLWMFSKRSPSSLVSFRRIVVPVCLVLVPVTLAMGYYCWRVTGSPLQMPYQAERQEYAVAPYLLWQPLHFQPEYHSEAMRQMYAHDEVMGYQFFASWVGVIAKLVWSWRFFLGPALTLPLLMMVVVLPNSFSWSRISRRTRLLLFMCAVGLLAMAAETFWNPHYLSPFTSVLLALAMLALRQLAAWRCWGEPSGLFLVRAVVMVCSALFLLRSAGGPLAADEFFAQAWYQRGALSVGRASMRKKLEGLPGNHLVIVRYKAERNLFYEWVYNEADIDLAKVVWAREISPDDDQKLLTYFHGRRIWLLEPDENPIRLSEYPLDGLHPPPQPKLKLEAVN